ncbi:MAG: GNAT family N-acetyltransferase [Vicinamibacterales bacterium]
MFADVALARRIDRAEASLSAEIAAAILARGDEPHGFQHPVGDGVAVCAGPGSPVTKVIGVGFDGALDEPSLARLEAEFLACGSPVRAEVSTLADPAFARQLTARGYTLFGFENVLACALTSSAPPRLPDGTAIGPAADHDTFMNVLIDGFASPDLGVVATLGESFPREILERTFADIATARGFSRYLATVDGAAASAASMRLCDGIAQLCGAATLPPFRRRGLQTALLHARLHAAATDGCDVAVVTTEPGSKSQQNAQRAGFALIYSRAILVKEP